MLTCTIGWRTLIPVRAIPYLTGGTFDARDVATLFFHPDKFAGDGFSPRTRAFRAGANGSLVAVASGEWGLAYHYLTSKGYRPQLELKHVRRLPAGVLVWRTPLKILYQFLARQDASADVRGLGDHPGGAFAWIEDFPLTAEQHAVVWEGIAPGLGNVNASRTPQRNSRQVLHQGLREEIERIIVDAKAKGLTVNKASMPGYKSDLIRILQERNPSRRGRADSTYHDDFTDLDLRWAGGRNRKDSEAFLACFGLKVE